MTLLRSTAFALSLLAAGVASAEVGKPVQEPVQPVGLDQPLAALPTPAPAGAEGEAMLFRLDGGGEVVGREVKQTPQDVYIDVGPTVITVPMRSVREKTKLSELRETQTGAGVGTGVFDPTTGSVVFRARQGGEEVLSREEILNRVKEAVVLVSNPGGLGTGWLVDESGRIVTNHHVIGDEAYQSVTVFLRKGEQWEKHRIENCKVEAFSNLLDIAIVQLDMAKVKELGATIRPLKIAAPGSLQAGESVFAVGNPGMGRMVLDHTISEGIASSLARNFNDVLYLQTTAAVNPGNSGGPLVNQRGEVVGLITLKALFQEGVAFALPVDYVHHFLRNSTAFALDEANRNKGFRYHRPQ